MSRSTRPDQGCKAKPSRHDRLKAALKANLSKRKEQAKSRDGRDKTTKSDEAG